MEREKHFGNLNLRSWINIGIFAYFTPANGAKIRKNRESLCLRELMSAKFNAPKVAFLFLGKSRKRKAKTVAMKSKQLK